VLGAPVRAAQDVTGTGDRPDEVHFEAGANLATRSGVKLLGLSASVRAALQGAGGVRWSTRDGRRTFFLRARAEALGALSAAMLGGAEVAAGADGRLSLTLDRDGRPVVLTYEGGNELSTRLKLPAPALLALGADGRGRAGRRSESDLRLDLLQPDNAAAAERFLGALLHPRELPGAARALGGRLLEHGDRDVRLYGTTASARERGGSIGFGPKVGASTTTEVRADRLRHAWSRPAGGVWERRLDCV